METQTTTPTTTNKETAMQDVTITPGMRFAAHRIMNIPTLDRASVLVRGIRQATYAESFPESYSPELVTASRRLLAICDPTIELDTMALLQAAADVLLADQTVQYR